MIEFEFVGCVPACHMIGYHLLADVYLQEFRGEWLKDEFLRQNANKVEELLQRHHNNVLSKIYKAFNNGAYSIVWLLAESHFSMHAWPEKRLICVDYFTCNLDSDVLQFWEDLLSLIGCVDKTKTTHNIYVRGIPLQTTRFAEQNAIEVKRWDE